MQWRIFLRHALHENIYHTRYNSRFVKSVDVTIPNYDIIAQIRNRALFSFGSFLSKASDGGSRSRKPHRRRHRNLSKKMAKRWEKTPKADEDSKEDDEEQFPNWASAVDHRSEKEIIRNVSQKYFYYRHSTTENNRSLRKKVGTGGFLWGFSGFPPTWIRYKILYKASRTSGTSRNPSNPLSELFLTISLEVGYDKTRTI